MNKKYRDDRIYKELIGTVLSKEGTEWLDRNLKIIRRVAEEE